METERLPRWRLAGLPCLKICRLLTQYFKTSDEVAAKGVDVELALDNPISFKQVGVLRPRCGCD